MTGCFIYHKKCTRIRIITFIQNKNHTFFFGGQETINYMNDEESQNNNNNHT